MATKFETIIESECVVCGADVPITVENFEVVARCPECGAEYLVIVEFQREGPEE